MIGSPSGAVSGSTIESTLSLFIIELLLFSSAYVIIIMEYLLMDNTKILISKVKKKGKKSRNQEKMKEGKREVHF